MSTNGCRFLRCKEVVALTGLPQSCLYEQMAAGHFPKNHKVGPKRVAWLESDVLAWQQAVLDGIATFKVVPFTKEVRNRRGRMRCATQIAERLAPLR